ncbi:hypothetical protein [Rosenbergiella epipactidis]|uniref:hypothetical protein n=1 Tax=Rosenbergiella epipactidis TaxID=1544694 RepID=UPI001F4EEC5A|nr:hypothetical protein [Rosenbergiella epipactidis]
MKATTLWIVTLFMSFVISSSISGVLAYRYKAALDRAEQAEGLTALQGKVIEVQQDQRRMANELSRKTLETNLRILAETERTVIQYREVLRHEKTCDYAVPDDIAYSLLGYAERLRTQYLSRDTNNFNRTDMDPVPARGLTYCQAVLWINPLLTALEQANNQLHQLRMLNQYRYN